MKRIMFLFATLFVFVVSMFAQTGEETVSQNFLEGFETFGTLVSIVIPAVVGLSQASCRIP